VARPAPAGASPGSANGSQGAMAAAFARLQQRSR
jgi:hypothetical protein